MQIDQGKLYIYKEPKEALPVHRLTRRAENLHVSNDFPRGETYSLTLQNYKHTVHIGIA